MTPTLSNESFMIECEDNMEEVLDEIDGVFVSKEEIFAEKEWKESISGEWDTDSCPHNKAEEEEYLRLQDMWEMEIELDSWEYNENAHDLFSKSPWDERNEGKIVTSDNVNKRSEINLWVEVTSIGDDYSTGTSDFGKVFISKKQTELKNLCIGSMALVTAQFKGFDSSRDTSMPWRSKYVNIVMDKEDYV